MYILVISHAYFLSINTVIMVKQNDVFAQKKEVNENYMRLTATTWGVSVSNIAFV